MTTERTIIAEVTIGEASGRVVGPLAIHGDGGPIQWRDDNRRRLEKAIERATDGRPLVGFYEPSGGYVRAYRHGHEDTDETTIDLRGATLVSWEA